jgi:hypothetical protein
MACNECAYLESVGINTGDWFEAGCVNKWSCRRKGNKFIGYTETMSQPKMPKWCPLHGKVKPREMGPIPAINDHAIENIEKCLRKVEVFLKRSKKAVEKDLTKIRTPIHVKEIEKFLKDKRAVDKATKKRVIMFD